MKKAKLKTDSGKIVKIWAEEGASGEIDIKCRVEGDESIWYFARINESGISMYWGLPSYLPFAIDDRGRLEVLNCEKS